MRWMLAILLSVLCVMTQSAHAKPAIVIMPSTVDSASLKVMTDAIETAIQFGENQAVDRELDRLRRRAQNAAQTALVTQGYFTARVTLRTQDDALGQTAWHIYIESGPRAKIAAVELSFVGAITLPQYRTRLAALRRAWTLPRGAPFANEAWDEAKAGLLGAMSERDFLLARVISSRADVYAEEGDVRLKVVFDSGPAIRLGALQIKGLVRFPASLVERYVRYTPGDFYEERKLNQWQQALQTTGFFRGVFLSVQLPSGVEASSNTLMPYKSLINPTMQHKMMRLPTKQDNKKTTLPKGMPHQTDHKNVVLPVVSTDQAVLTLPLQVRVIEVHPKQWATSLGVDSDTGVGGEVIYRQSVVWGQPLTLESGVGVNRLHQRAYLDFHLPLNAQGYKDSMGVLADHNNIEGEETKRVAVAVSRRQVRYGGPDERVSYETRWGIAAAHSDKIVLGVTDPHVFTTLTGTLDWLRRDVEVDTRHTPRAGHLLGVGVATGVILNNGQPYSNLQLRGQQWWPVGRYDVFTWRAEVGRAWVNGKTVLPPDIGFRTGGARSIRGYSYLSIGVPEGNAVVEAPLLLTASLEYDHYFNARWGLGFFVDTGDATKSLGDRPLALGYGAGIRVSTPAGPLFLDVAYGQRNRLLRLSFSLGTAF